MVDKRLISVYGDTVHQNDGRHIHGGIVDDELWQALWLRIVSYPHSLYNPSNGHIGKLFISTVTAEWRGVRERKWNSERQHLFAPVIR